MNGWQKQAERINGKNTNNTNSRSVWRAMIAHVLYRQNTQKKTEFALASFTLFIFSSPTIKNTSLTKKIGVQQGFGVSIKKIFDKILYLEIHF